MFIQWFLPFKPIDSMYIKTIYISISSINPFLQQKTIFIVQYIVEIKYKQIRKN